MNLKIVTLRKDVYGVVACIPICEHDARLWLDRLLTNLWQFPIGVAWFCDNCSASTINHITKYPRTIGYANHVGSEPYNESCRNYPMSIAVESGASWMFRMDSDETIVVNDWHLVELCIAFSYHCSWKFRWYNVWQECLPLPLIRYDPPFRPNDNYRVVLHPLKGYSWEFRKGTTASAYCNREIEEKVCDARLIHWGFSTPELRKFHKERWDKLYRVNKRGEVCGDGSPNPYGMWNAACDEGKAWLWPWKPWLSHEEWITEAGDMISKSDRPDQYKVPWER